MDDDRSAPPEEHGEGIDEKDCWTIQEVAAYLGISQDAARGQLSRMGIRGETHYPVQEIIARHTARKGRGNWRRDN